jgi:hypothetical protein
MIATHTVPSLQGTLAKRTKPTLQPNFAKEPFRPSRSDTGLSDSANMIVKQIEYKRQCLTRNIRKPGDVGVLNFCTFTQNCNGLISWSFEIPASAYCHPLYAIKTSILQT